MKRKIKLTTGPDKEYKVFKNYEVKKEPKSPQKDQKYVVPWEMKDKQEGAVL